MEFEGGMMEVLFWEQFGNEIEFQNNSDLLKKLPDIGCTVPGRTRGRKSSHREKYCLKIYLEYLLQNELLKFPMKLRKDESPDFFISYHDGITISLEHTDASTEDYQCALTKLAKMPEGTLLEMGTNKLVKTGEQLIGPGWTGNTVEIEWVNIILNSIKNKTQILNQARFKTADRYELLIHDNSHLSTMLRVQDALPLLKKLILEEFQNTSFTKNFDLISIIHHNQLFYDVGSEFLVTNN